MIKPTTIFKLCDDIRHSRVGDEAVVLCQDKVEVLVVNDVAARLIELIDGNRMLYDLLSQLEQEYEVEHKVLKQDVTGYIDELVASNVIITT